MPTQQTHILQRFDELAVAGQKISILAVTSRQAEPQAFYAWVTSALSLLEGVFGKGSPHFTNLQAEILSIRSNFVSERQYKACLGIFLGAKDDADGGHIYRLETSTAGEVFGDFVALAKTTLDQGHHTVATVLACAALEDALKRFAVVHNLDVTNKTMEEIVNGLKSKGLVSGAQKGLLEAMPKIRNYAMHAEWQKLTAQDAGSVIGFVEQFLLHNFR